MKVKELIKLLKKLDQDATIDMSTDEEGNAYGDISDVLGTGTLQRGGKVYILYPETCEMPEDRYVY